MSPIREIIRKKSFMKHNQDGLEALLKVYGPAIVLPLLFFFMSIIWGRYMISPSLVLKMVAGKLLGWADAWPATLETVLFKIRIPRVAAAMLIGGGLSVSGASFQGLFRNPLVSPFILGVASGAGFGAALAILVSGNALVVQISAFLFGALAVFISYGLTRLYRTSSVLVMVLSGVIVGTFFSALISLIKYVADPYDKLPVIVFWLMGSLAVMTSHDFLVLAFPICLGFCVLFFIRWKINVLAMGEEEAKSLGLGTARLRLLIVLCATLITAAAVSVSGIIGWVGLVIPHLTRMIVGPDYRKVVPVSFSLGACYLVLVDDIARNLTSVEIPLGILTATIGAPFFALLLRKGSLGWS